MICTTAPSIHHLQSCMSSQHHPMTDIINTTTVTSYKRWGRWNHWYLDCLLNSFFKQTKNMSNLYVTGTLWGEIHWSPVDSPHKGPVMQNTLPYQDITILHPVTVLWQAHAQHPTIHHLCISSHITPWQIYANQTAHKAPPIPAD